MAEHVDSGKDEMRSNAIRVFTYVKDVVQQLSSRAILHTDKYEGVLWLDRLMTHSGSKNCFAHPGTGSEEVWISVAKQPEPRIPEPPAKLRAWITPGSGVSEKVPPRLSERILDPTGEEDENGELCWLTLSDNPTLEPLFQSYCNGPWQEWAKTHTEWLGFHEHVYRQLFRLHQELTRLGEEYELVLGMGCLSWQSEGATICRHLVTVRASLSLDPATGHFTIGPNPDSTEFHCELDMLPSQSRPVREVIEHIDELLASSEGDPTNRDGLDSAIRAVMNSLDGDYDAGRFHSEQPRERPFAAFAPAVILRKRSGAGRLTFFESIVGQLSTDIELPACVSQLVQEREVPAGVGERSGTSGTSTGPDRTYFPLPANDDQIQIAERLSARNGVLVQGPPGTGKSHTITNLLCHLLASGKRVLVTAQTPRALQVLREKIKAVPGDGGLADLCVSMLGDDRVAQGDLERSVANIIERKDRWDTARESETKRLEQMERDVADLELQRATLRAQLRQLSEAESKLHKIGEFSSEQTAQRIAEATHQNAPLHDWIQDRPPLESSLNVSASDLEELLRLAHEISPEIAFECTRDVPVPGDNIPESQMIESLLRVHESGTEKFGGSEPSESLRAHAPADHLATHRAVANLATAVAGLGIDESDKWQIGALRDTLVGNRGQWEVLLLSSKNAIDKLEPDASVLSSDSVSLPSDKPAEVLRADVADLVRHVVEQRRSLGFWIFKPAVVRRSGYVLENCIINGQRANSPDSLQHLSRYLNLCSVLDGCWSLWRDVAEQEPKNPATRLAALRELSATLQKITELAPLVDEAKARLTTTYSDATGRLSQPSALASIASECHERFARSRYSEATSKLNAISRKCREMASLPTAHPVCAELAEAVGSRNPGTTTSCLARIGQLLHTRTRHSQQLASKAKISSQLPLLAHAILTSPEDTRWAERFARFDESFKWAKMKSWVDSRPSHDSRHGISESLQGIEARILELTGKVAAARAWKSCFEAMSESHRRSLVQWQQAIAKLGKGTGIYAYKWRRAAQGELDRCKDAIPAWIMPLYRVFETVPPKPGLFDVVIVDEASQCGLDGLGLMFLGKKVIVVGDNEQISPSYVGVDREDMDRILKARLGHMQSRQSFDIENSLFDHAARLFDARVTLREHFRCVPDIIRFSNGLSYNNRLIPLRQYPPKRLAPLVHHHVPHGSATGTSGRKTNYIEADALVNAVIACCKDKAYEGKSMGVISLLGDRQAAYIEQQLLRNLGPEEMLKRKIICGDAYSFQGDERHVMFMSLVVSGDARFNALTSRSDKQRFNVAASRAQDQCWLFHSVDASDITNAECVRKQLLTHFYDPARSVAESDGIDLPALRRQASDRSRPELPPPPFGSWFEVDVYLRIIDRGYPTRVQYPMGAYRVDLVVEGATRLAVECDGDRWHGPERFDDDLRRQRQLERAGLKFWRVGGSTFYANPENALQGLWTRLRELGIEPAKGDDATMPLDGYVAPFEMPTALPDNRRSSAATTTARAETSATTTLSSRSGTEHRLPTPAPTASRSITAKETAERAEIQSLQAQLRAIWATQGRTEQAVPASRLRLIQLIEAATVSPGSTDAEPEGDVS
jgi:very-short-patch-repair endonuclease